MTYMFLKIVYQGYYILLLVFNPQANNRVPSDICSKKLSMNYKIRFIIVFIKRVLLKVNYIIMRNKTIRKILYCILSLIN